MSELLLQIVLKLVQGQLAQKKVLTHVNCVQNSKKHLLKFPEKSSKMLRKNHRTCTEKKQVFFRHWYVKKSSMSIDNNGEKNLFGRPRDFCFKARLETVIIVNAF